MLNRPAPISHSPPILNHTTQTRTTGPGHASHDLDTHTTRTGRVRLPGAPSIQINAPVVHPNALPLNITPSSSPVTLSINKAQLQVNKEPFTHCLFHNRHACLGLCSKEIV